MNAPTLNVSLGSSWRRVSHSTSERWAALHVSEWPQGRFVVSLRSESAKGLVIDVSAEVLASCFRLVEEGDGPTRTCRLRVKQGASS